MGFLDELSKAGGLAGIKEAVTGVVNDIAKDMKVCPSCGKPAGAEEKFCQNCGAKLPEETMGQGAVCPGCGKQNKIGMKFCAECGTKLPVAVAEEQAAQAENEATMANWDNILPQYPKWNGGGTGWSIEEMSTNQYGKPIYCFTASFRSEGEAEAAAANYRNLLAQNGFVQAGQYKDPCQLYKMIGTGCFHVDTEHLMDGGCECFTIYFDEGEPNGGFNYVKPQEDPLADLKKIGSFLKKL